jgi:P4 family phage/plasmid primase-like protien
MANGILDVDALLADQDECLQPNTPQWFSQVNLPYALELNAVCPEWEAFLDYNLDQDPELVKLSQEWAGYLLTQSTDEQKFMILEGEGKNGKSVFIAGVSAMLGLENVSNVALENFGDRFQLTNTIGKLLNAAGDCGELDKTAEGLIKSFVAGDRMYFDRKGLSGFNAVPTARLMVACNNRPRFSDRSDGIWRRMLVVPWTVAIDKQKRRKGMDKIVWWQASGELPGMFLWALRGLDRLRKQRDFTESEAMNKTIAEYKREMNPAKAFLVEMCDVVDLAQTTRGELYKLYGEWCKANGHSHALSQMQFGKEVKRQFPKIQIEREATGDRPWYYSGLSVKKTF